MTNYARILTWKILISSQINFTSVNKVANDSSYSLVMQEESPS